uniref:Uncharacterized protein n=1 Tax=Cuerna arida TaxID=1464854 RepID=A0A1B6F9U1_9HEMI
MFCSPEVLRMAYFGLIHPHLAYGIRLWGGCAKHRMERVFRLQKKAIRVIAKLKLRESCKDAFRKLGLLTLPCLYVLDVILFCKSRGALTQGRNVHHYQTRGRDNFRVLQHRLTVTEQLPVHVGVRLTNVIPERIKMLENQNQFKSRLKRHLVYGAFYSVDEYVAGRWDN